MRFNPKIIFLFVFAIDLIVIILHLLLSSNFNFFNFDWESNLPTIYQGLKLALIGAIFFAITLLLKITKQIKDRNLLLFWFGLALLLILMGFDEAAQIHEFFPLYIAELFPKFADWYTNVFRAIGFNSSIWIAYLLPIFPIFLLWLLKVAKTAKNKYGKNLLKLLFGFALIFIGAFVFEFIGTTNEIFFSNWFEVVMIFEESFELFGATIILYYAISEIALLSQDIKKGQV